jgi:tetratricopeptide (TPR) repeat protein
MANKLTASLRAAPATIPSLVAVAVFVILATDQAGYPVTHWAPGGLVVLVLLGLTVSAVGLPLAEVPRLVKVALGCLAAYAALSFLSMSWAGVPADAWEGANRTLIYLMVFALFACWRQRGASAALLLVAWSLALSVVAGYVALHVDEASRASLQNLLPGGRLIYPSGYANANAALWLMPFWAALLLSASERLPWGLRGLLAGASVLLADVALLSQSRGSLYATPVVLLLVFALVPWRARIFAALVPVAAGIAAAAPTVLRVGNHLSREEVVPAHVHSAITAIFLSAVIAGLVVAAGAAIEGRVALPEGTAHRVRRAVGAVAVATLVAALAAGWAAAGDPVARVRHAWDTFKSGRGYAANSPGARLTSGLGSQRYDFYRVALDEFLAHPLVGIGADNFQQQYLVHGHSHETPHYPHSVELRTLAETGLAGTALAVVGLGAALLAGLRACRARLADPEGRLAASAAAAALAGFGYWLVHGSFDWFFEFAGLGAPAFAMLGLACSLTPNAGSAPSPRRRLRAWRPRRLALATGAIAGLAAALSLAVPWFSGLEIDDAAHSWTRAPLQAYTQLDDAAALNPWSDEPYLLAGSIALRFGDLARADHEFSLALKRVPGGAYATLERGAIASNRGERAAALRVLGRAARLAPRDRLVAAALRVARRGQRLDLDELNRAILAKGRELR